MANSTTVIDNETLGGVVLATGQPSATFKTNVICRGTCTANGATPVAVAAATITAAQVIAFSPANGATSTYSPFPTTVTVGTGFSFASQSGDTNVYNFKVF